jgi:hypothetical protein
MLGRRADELTIPTHTAVPRACVTLPGGRGLQLRRSIRVCTSHAVKRSGAGGERGAAVLCTVACNRMRCSVQRRVTRACTPMP